MTAAQFVNGNACYFDGEKHRYVKDNVPVSSGERPCPRCGEMPTPEGFDACLGEIPGAVAACCGHGLIDGYVLFPDGRRERISQ